LFSEQKQYRRGNYRLSIKIFGAELFESILLIIIPINKMKFGADRN